MRIATIARFMQMNGAITGWRDRLRWFQLPRRNGAMVGNAFGYRLIGRGGLRIVSTVVAGDALKKRAGDAHASGGTPG